MPVRPPYKKPQIWGGGRLTVPRPACRVIPAAHHRGTICNWKWNASAGSAVCLHVGYHRGAVRADSQLSFGPGDGPVAIDSLVCPSGVPDITVERCSVPPPSPDHFCTHADDAAVICRMNRLGAVGELALRLTLQGTEGAISTATLSRGQVEVQRIGESEW